MASAQKRWWQSDVAPGYLLMAAAVASFTLLNSGFGHAFEEALHAKFLFEAPGVRLEEDLHHLINDGLMAVFFLYVGLELKRECIDGPFANPREAALPLAGAIGGMAAPALIYLALTSGEPALQRGWAIPAATDIAFALGILALLGKSVPSGLRLFLLTLAIADDLGAIIIIALFYSSELAMWALIGAALSTGALFALNRLGVKALTPYWLIAVVLWYFMLKSGVHATIAGVVTALMAPMRRPDGRSPLIAAEHALKPWVSLAIMPIFALANAGVPLAGMSLDVLAAPLTLGVGLGLVLGKPLGITLATVIAAALLRRPLPARLPQLLGVTMIAGVGFTMSLFIGGLAFTDPIYAAEVRVGVLGGSIISAILGLVTLSIAIRTARGAQVSPDLAEDEETAERQGVL